MWGSSANTTWERWISRADILERAEQGFLWCKVPKAASESWTSLFINKWFWTRRKLVMWQQQVYLNAQWRPKYRKFSYLNKISKHYFSWITVRHPFERLLSAYRLAGVIGRTWSEEDYHVLETSSSSMATRGMNMRRWRNGIRNMAKK